MLKKYVKDHSGILTSLLINIVFLVGIVLFVGVRFELSDDWFIARNIASGNYDMIFCDYFLQVITGLLQKIIYPYNAFIILQIVLGFLSLTIVSYILFDTFKFKKGIWAVLFVECVFAVNAYSLITFTKTAGLLMVAGGLLMLWAYHEKKHIGYSVFGILLVLFGSFYRFKIFYSVLAVFCFFILACVLAKAKKGSFFRSIFNAVKEILSLKTIALVLVMLIAVFSCKYISSSIFYSTDEMQYYREYNSARAKVVDWIIPYYELNVEAYEQLGISENDYNMLLDWYFDDKGYSDLETLQQVIKLADSEVDVVNRIKSGIYSQTVNLLTLEPDGILTLAYLIVAAVVFVLYKKGWIFVGGTALPIGLLYSYLYIDGRVRYRAVMGFWFAAIILLIYAVKFLEKRKFADKITKNGEVSSKITKVVSTVVSVVVLIALLLLTTVKMVPELDTSMKLGSSNLSNYISATEGKTFVLSRKAYAIVRDSTVIADALHVNDDDVFSKCVYYGSPYYAHPLYNKLLEDLDIENLYTDIVDNEEFYFLAVEGVHFYDGEKYNEIDSFVEYLNEQYADGETVYGYQLVEKIYEDTYDDTDTHICGIYKIVTVK